MPNCDAQCIGSHQNVRHSDDRHIRFRASSRYVGFLESDLAGFAEAAGYPFRGRAPAARKGPYLSIAETWAARPEELAKEPSLATFRAEIVSDINARQLMGCDASPTRWQCP
jgi:hypothetical protein